MITKIKYEFSAKIWQHSAPGGWYFVSLPVELSNEIRENLKWQEEGWGRLKASAKIGNSEWNTLLSHFLNYLFCFPTGYFKNPF